MWSHIDEVERFLNLILIKRGRPNYLTVEGLRFLPVAKEFISSFETGLNQLQNKSYEARGKLVVSTTSATVSWLIPSIKEFHDIYPNLRIDITAEDELSAAMKKNADVLLRPVNDEDLENFNIHWCIRYRLALYASKEYLAKYGMPRKPDDLKEHCILSYGKKFSGFPEVDWLLEGEKYGLPPLKPTLKINSTRALFDAASNGIGIISNPFESVSIYHSDLTHVLPEIEGPLIETRFCGRKEEDEQTNVNIRIFSSFFEKNLSSLGLSISDTYPSKQESL